MEKYIKQAIKALSSFQDLSLFIVRIILAYGFYEPAVNKLKHFSEVVLWFKDGLHIPFPFLNAILAVTTEVSGIILITLGLMTRFISVPMMVIMLVAIAMVHGKNGFLASNNGFEIPLYYMIMLSVLLTTGPGKFSLDETVLKKYFGNGK